ncbi:uncharacterized protein LOC116210796 [Punica granatum]|uniref:Molybdenum cofactor sulfurase n=2 Tax=Punica granatum TaxID=22663 RepID=A0A218WIR8_PUNGR|nr:uncharacterized protein LOC116210796 [Punica granatum]OWM72526.1 hypothetical protein CDL15_Pgr018379 [Punica granatum]PKI54335.1 hypothetical protein CRG98_025271 [Punica granatum]
MNWFSWKPLAHCAAIVFDKKSKNRDGPGPTPIEAKGYSGGSRERKLREAIQEASEIGSLTKALEIVFNSPASEDEPAAAAGRSRTLARLECQGFFLRSTAEAAGTTFDSEDSIPNVEEAASKFLAMYPSYSSSQKIDQLRANEYSHLFPKVCLDFCGFGLFSYLQSVHYWESSTFSLSEITANLSNHALYGGGERGTAEYDIKTRIMEFLNIPENEYGLVFTVSRGSAFKLLSDAYPFHTNRRLLTMFDHESQSINWMAQSAREKGAKVNNAWFKWPTLQPCSTDLRKQILNKKKRKKASAVGLFVFPVQSRVSGAKYSYQWMALAHQNNWHVLLDAGALGPKDMDSLGLSLFRPDFIVTSFYRVFGYDPSGFGCLLIKKSVMGSLQNQSGATGSGMVKITPEFPLYLGDSMDGLEGIPSIDDEAALNGDCNASNNNNASEARAGQQLPAFSGLYTSAQVKDVFETEMNDGNISDRDGASTCFEESGSISIGDMMKSPVFSENGSSDYSYWIDLGQSPVGNDNGAPLTPTWMNGRKKERQLFLKPSSKVHGSPLFDNGDDHTRGALSFDAAVQSAFHDPDRLRHIDEIKEEPEPATGDSHLMNECSQKESAIRRETEADFRLLRSRRTNRYAGGGRFFGVEESEQINRGRRVSFSTEDNHRGDQVITTAEHGEVSANGAEDEEYSSEGEYGDELDSDRKEPEISCWHLDHINELGLNKTSSRLRFLINWLVASLLQLRLPNGGETLVYIYGPKIKYERGAAVAFNIRDRSKNGLVSPELVQRLAEREGISVGIGFLSHIQVVESSRHQHGGPSFEETTVLRPLENGSRNSSEKKAFVRIEVVTASLGFLSNFEDVYKLWAFVAKFLNPGFAREGELPTVAEESEA